MLPGSARNKPQESTSNDAELTQFQDHLLDEIRSLPPEVVRANLSNIKKGFRAAVESYRRDQAQSDDTRYLQEKSGAYSRSFLEETVDVYLSSIPLSKRGSRMHESLANTFLPLIREKPIGEYKVAEHWAYNSLTTILESHDTLDRVPEIIGRNHASFAYGLLVHAEKRLRDELSRFYCLKSMLEEDSRQEYHRAIADDVSLAYAKLHEHPPSGLALWQEIEHTVLIAHSSIRTALNRPATSHGTT